MLHLTVSTFLSSRRNQQRILCLGACHCFSAEHTSILAHMVKRLHPLHCKSWRRDFSTFLGHTFVRIYIEPPQIESIPCEIRDLRKVGANKVLGMEFGWIVWEGLGLKAKNTSGSTFSFSSAWGHLALWCDNCRGNYSKSLTVCRNTVRDYTVLPPPSHYKQGFNVVPNKYIRKSLCAFQLMFLIPLAILLPLHRVPRNSKSN